MDYYTCKICNKEIDIRMLEDHREECIASKLSGKEIELLNYIERGEINITAESIKTDLGEAYIGALGKLIRYELIEGNKKNIGTISHLNPYGRRWTKVYTIKEEKE